MSAARRADHYRRKVERERLDGYGWVMSLDSVRTPEEILLIKQRMERLERNIDKLQPRIGRVLRLRLGINCKAHTFDEIAEQYGVTRERVRQMEVKALRIIKRWTFIEEKPEQYRRECENQAKVYKERREAELAEIKAEAAEDKTKYDSDWLPVGVLRPRAPTILDDIVKEQRRELALERRWVAEREAWLRSPLPDWAEVKAEVKPYPYKLRKVPSKRDWLNVATEGFSDGA